MTKFAVTTLIVADLFDSKTTYYIPIYQRNYAWEEPQITQLIRDIFDKFQESQDQNYYIGTLVVDVKEATGLHTHYETIDGQQRHTTLSIVLAALRQLKVSLSISKLNIKFECRARSKATLDTLFESGTSDESKFILFEPNILSAFHITYNFLKRQVTTERLEDFTAYLLNKVIIVRTCLPKKTDLNHYFEIMNNRGEQLENHEVIKARLMSELPRDEQVVFAQIWDACSDMGHYVQYRFSNSLRSAIFGEDLKQLLSSNSDSCDLFNFVLSVIKLNSEHKDNKDNKDNKDTAPKSNDNSGEPPTLLSLFKNAEHNKKAEESQLEIIDDRFSSVINFPNFLLHVLRLFQIEFKLSSVSVSLDDKKLIKEFDVHILKVEGIPVSSTDIKRFASTLLKARILFDNYIIKRDLSSNETNWGLRRLERKENVFQPKNTFGHGADKVNEQLVMLQTMFHASYPANSYKNWLASLLKYLYDQGEINGIDFINNTEQVAYRQFHLIVMGSKDKTLHLEKEKLLAAINCGTGVQNYIFNYLDYRILQEFNHYVDSSWQEVLLGTTSEELLDSENVSAMKKIVNTFKFTNRSSVEHHYPQTSKVKTMESKLNDSFANLCLVSSSTNSSLGNASPEEKKQIITARHKHKAESLKQRLMFCYKDWYVATDFEQGEVGVGIKIHGKVMVNLLLN
jgi:uncharacterized protein with ParB-like and HNH nuclease domain